MEQPPEEIRFNNVLTGLVSFVSEIDKKNPGVTTLTEGQYKLVKVALIAGDKIEMIEEYGSNSRDFWGMILSEDESFFLERIDQLFSGFPKEYVKQLERLFKSGRISRDDKGVIWRYLKSLTKITMKYLHKKGEDVRGDIILWKIKV